MELPREDPIRPRDLLIIAGVIACLFGAYRAVKWILTPSLTFVRIQPMAGTESGCRVEVWVAGKNVELRRAGSQLPLEGVLQRPTQRR